MGIIEFYNNDKDDDNDKKQRSQLWIHSPVSLTEDLVEVLKSLGDVKWVVSPNYEHVKYAQEWAEWYEDAVMVACPGVCVFVCVKCDGGGLFHIIYVCVCVCILGLMERMDGVYHVEIPFGIRPGDDLDPNTFWDGSELVSLHIDCEVNPFTGKPFFNEVIFFHVPSKTLLVTDLYWNYPASVVTNEIYSDLPGGDVDYGSWELAPTVEKIPFGTRAWKFGMDQIYRPFYVNFMIKDEDRSRYNSIVDQIINVWEVETLIPAHGDIIRGKQVIKYVLQKHFGVK